MRTRNKAITNLMQWTPVSLAIFYYIESDGSSYASKICKNIDVTYSHVSKTLKELVRRGVLIESGKFGRTVKYKPSRLGVSMKKGLHDFVDGMSSVKYKGVENE